jgi:hypothetical protein
VKHPTPASCRRLDDDGGITLVLVALLMVAILLMAALAIDGGIAYQSHRQSQNAADVGAMAGTRVLEQVKFDTACGVTSAPGCTKPTWSDIALAVKAQAVATGADPSTVSCQLVDINGGVYPNTEFCVSGLDISSRISTSFGIQVTAARTRSTYFANVAGFKTTKATSTATSFIYDFAGGTGSPFIACGNAAVQGFNLVTLQSPPPAPPVWNAVSSSVGKYYELQGSNPPDCDAHGSSFDGKNGSGVIPSLPYDQPISTGNGNSSTVQVAVAGQTACPPTGPTPGCALLIPIASDSQGTGRNTTMHIVAWMAFQVWGNGTGSYSFAGNRADLTGTSCGNPLGFSGGSMKYCGKLLGPVTVTGGNVGGSGSVGASHVIRLSQ